MQQLIVNIPDNKIAFFLDLAKNLGFTIENRIQKNVLTEKQIDLINDAHNQIKENPDHFSDLDDKLQEKYLADLKHEFETYKGIWENETMLSSSTTEMTNHPAYLHIISLGKDVVPLLLRDMMQSSNHWFCALHKLTGANPVPKEHRGKIQLMIKDWLQWAKDNNIDF